MSLIQLAKLLGWTSLAVGVIEIAATKWLQNEMGVKGHEVLIRTFGAREIAAGVSILSQPGLNQSLANGLWARVVGDALDLAMLGLASRETSRPCGLATMTAIVAGITGFDFLIASAAQQELANTSRLAASARRRAQPSQALPKGPLIQRSAE